MKDVRINCTHAGSAVGRIEFGWAARRNESEELDGVYHDSDRRERDVWEERD